MSDGYKWATKDPRTRVALERTSEYVHWAYQQGYRDSLADDLLYVLRHVQQMEKAQ